MNGNGFTRDNQIGSFDPLTKIRCGWRHLLGGGVLGLVAASMLLMTLSPVFEAVVVVAVGQVGHIGLEGQPMSLAVEPATYVLERMKTPEFQLNVAQAAGNQEWIADLKRSASGTTKFLSLNTVKGSASGGKEPLIELKAKAATPEQAETAVMAAVKELARRQGELAAPVINKMRTDASIAKEKLESAVRELETVGKLRAEATVKDERFTQLSLMTDLRVQKEAEVFKERQKIALLETTMASPYTQPARALEKVFASDKPVSPKKSLLLALGLVCGLLGGLLVVFFIDPTSRGSGSKAVR